MKTSRRSLIRSGIATAAMGAGLYNWYARRHPTIVVVEVPDAVPKREWVPASINGTLPVMSRPLQGLSSELVLFDEGKQGLPSSGLGGDVIQRMRTDSRWKQETLAQGGACVFSTCDDTAKASILAEQASAIGSSQADTSHELGVTHTDETRACFAGRDLFKSTTSGRPTLVLVKVNESLSCKIGHRALSLQDLGSSLWKWSYDYQARIRIRRWIAEGIRELWTEAKSAGPAVLYAYSRTPSADRQPRPSLMLSTETRRNELQMLSPMSHSELLLRLAQG